MRCRTTLILFMAAGLHSAQHAAAVELSGTEAMQNEAIVYIDSIRGELVACNQDIWAFAELGLEEYRSAARLIGILKKAGFTVHEEVSGMPTAFVAEYGSGKPIVGILAEYDALPELSQQSVGVRQIVEGRTTGHGCGHCALGTGAVGAALAAKKIYDNYKLKGTLQVYGQHADDKLIDQV